MVIGYNFPFHMHILCIRYGTVLANAAVLSMHVRIVCLPVRGAPGECYYNTVLYNAACVHAVSLHCAKNI